MLDERGVALSHLTESTLPIEADVSGTNAQTILGAARSSRAILTDRGVLAKSINLP